jgi:hypothetical protein
MVDEYGFNVLTAEVVMAFCMSERGTVFDLGRIHPAEVITSVCADYGIDPRGYIARYCVDRRMSPMFVESDRRR